MSLFLDKAKQKVKKKVGGVVDRFRPSPRESRAPSPTSTQQSEHSTIKTPVQGQLAPVLITASPMAQSSIPPISVAVPSSQLPHLDSAGASSSALETNLPAVPAYARPPSPPTILATTGAAVKGLLVAARDGSDLFLPLKAALVGVVALWDIFDRTVEAKAEFMKLESKLVAFKAIADAHQLEPRALDESLQTRLKSLTRAVQGLWEAVEKRQSRGGFARGAQSSIDLGDIKTLVDAISSLLEVFQFESSIAVEKRLGLIVEHLKRTQNAMKTIKSVLGDNFVSEAADYEQPSYAGCMTGTRVGVLSKFIAWVKDDPLAIFWLAGMAGTGKTSVAVSLCRMLRADPTVTLAGGYFCSRSAGSIARTDVRRILPTLAVLLASQSQEFAESLAAELEKDHSLGHKPVVDQIGPLLRQPLATFASSSRPIVFLVDGLDECSNERELAELLRLLANFECETKIKFILTSRPELHIRGTPISNPTHNTILQLHTISAEEVTSDIRLYIGGALKEGAPEGTWYTDHDVDALVLLCGGLFIFASTVLLYVLDPEEDDERHDRLRKVTSTAATSTAATAAVDKIYEIVLTEASRSGTADTDELERMKRILACILIARAPLSVEALSALAEMKPSRLRAALRRLHSLVHLPTNDNQPGLRTLHASFGDYLHDRAPQHLRIPATLGHDVLARGCLRRMAWDDLHFNISRSQSSFEPNPEIEPDWISISLIYACLNWAHHIDAASDHAVFDADIERNFRAKFMFWLEVLSVLGKISFASGLLRIAGSVVNTPVTSQFLRDANSFVASSSEAISRSAPHIYTSALPFAPKDSLVYRDFAPLSTGVVSVTASGIDRHGGRLVATLTGHDGEVRSVRYSPDSRLLASGSTDGTVRIWDTRTGQEIMTPLRSNDNDEVISVVFSPDGQWITSYGRNSGVHIWSIATGRAALLPQRIHVNRVQSVAFSPDGNYIAFVSFRLTVHLWNISTGLEVWVINERGSCVNAVTFSFDGRLLATASDDKTVRLWKSANGDAVGDPLTGLEDDVENVAFSPDGIHLAAASRTKREIRFWDLDTREPANFVIANQVPVSFLVFSPDGLRLLSAGRHNIRSWDTRTGREVPTSPLASHSGLVNSVAFSHDGLFLASGSADCTVRIWDAVDSFESPSQQIRALSSTVSSLAINSAGTSIVSGLYDRSVQVWDTFTGEAKLQPLLGHTDLVLGVAISSDDRFIASASADSTIRLWDAQTGQPVGKPLKGDSTQFNSVAFSPDSLWLASGSDDRTVRAWEVKTRQVAPFGPLGCSGLVLAVAFSPDGLLLAAGDNLGRVYLWHSETGQPTGAPLEDSSYEGVYCIVISPDSKRIVSGADDNFVRVWDIENGHQAFRLDSTHVSRVRSVAYSPDSRYFASASWDKTVRLWDANTGAVVSTLYGHGNRVAAVKFTPNGKSLISGGTDHTIHIWDVETALLLPSQAKQDPLARLGCAVLDDSGWLVGPSGELLLWVPADYRGYIPLPPCSMIIGPYRIDLTFDDGPHWGDQWTKCWRNNAHPVARPSPGS